MAESRFTYTKPERGGAKAGGAATGRIEVPVACDWAALSSGQHERQQELYRQLREDVREVRELEDGYAFRHSGDRDVLLAVAEFVANERQCCPFFEFGITVERGGGPVWLRMTGEGKAKRVLEAGMGVGS
jgi:hypothetical protein